MDPRISMITLGVDDLERAIRFYEHGLGLPRHPSAGEVSFFALAGTWLGLYGREALARDAGRAAAAPAGTFGGIALAHNVASRAAVDAVLAEAVGAGATLLRAAADTDWGGYSGYFADPDGHPWEVAWNPHAWVGPPAAGAGPGDTR